MKKKGKNKFHYLIAIVIGILLVSIVEFSSINLFTSLYESLSSERSVPLSDLGIGSAFASNSQGTTILAWENTSGDILTGKYDKKGKLIKSGPTIDRESDAYYPAVSIADDGNYIVVWKELDENEITQIMFQRFDPENNQIDTDPVQVTNNTNESSDLVYPRVSMSGKDLFLITWLTGPDNDSDFFFKMARGKLYETSPDGGLISKDISLNKGSSPFVNKVYPFINKNGKYIIIWENRDSEGFSKSIGINTNIGGVSNSITSNLGVENPRAFIDPEDNLYIVWQEGFIKSDILLSIYDGNSLTDPIKLNKEVTEIYFDPSVLVDKNNNVVTVYKKEDSLMYAVYDRETGQILESDIVLNNDLGLESFDGDLDEYEEARYEENFYIESMSSIYLNSEEILINWKGTNENILFQLLKEPSIPGSPGGGSSRRYVAPDGTEIELQVVDMSFRLKTDSLENSVNYFQYLTEPLPEDEEKLDKKNLTQELKTEQETTEEKTEEDLKLKLLTKTGPLSSSDFLKLSGCSSIGKWDSDLGDFDTEVLEMTLGEIYRIECPPKEDTDIIDFQVPGTETNEVYDFDYFLDKSISLPKEGKKLEADPVGTKILFSLKNLDEPVSSGFITNTLNSKFENYDQELAKTTIEIFNFDEQKFMSYPDGTIQEGSIYKIEIVDKNLEILTEKIPETMVGEDYETSFSVENAIEPMIWSIPQEQIPDGLNIQNEKGILYGIPITPGIYDFTVSVKDANKKTTSKEFELKVNPGDGACFVSKYIECMDKDSEVLFVTCVMQKYTRSWLEEGSDLLKTSLFGT